MTITQATADSLSAKLDALDLDENETRLLAAVLNSASSISAPEVEGHGFDERQASVSLLSIDLTGVKYDVRPWAGKPMFDGKDDGRVVADDVILFSKQP